MADKRVVLGRREFVTGLVAAGLGAAVKPASAQPKSPWTTWLSPREGLGEAHLDLTVPAHVFSTLKDVSHYSFVLCGHELFSCTSAKHASGNRKLHGTYVVEPKSEHELRVFARLNSGEFVRQTQSVTLKLPRKYAFRTLSVRVGDGESFVANVKEIAPKFDEYFKYQPGYHGCVCSVRG